MESPHIEMVLMGFGLQMTNLSINLKYFKCINMRTRLITNECVYAYLA